MDAAEYQRMAQLQDHHWWFEAKRRTVAALLAHHGVVPVAGSGGAASTAGGGDAGSGGVASTGGGGDARSGGVASTGGGRGAASTGGGGNFGSGGVPAAGASSAGRPAGRVLEVGPGTGSMVGLMSRYGRMVAADAYLPALRLLVEHRPAAAVAPVGADLLTLPFAPATFSLIGCFDVLYHRNVGDVAAAIAELHRVCRPGGHLAITDSAFELLRSAHDVATHGARRFRLRDLTVPLQAAGFEVRHATYFHTLLFPAALALRLGKRALRGAPRRARKGHGADGGEERADDDVAAHSDLAPVPAWLNATLRALYRVEAPMAARRRMPFGSSLLILARRPY